MTFTVYEDTSIWQRLLAWPRAAGEFLLAWLTSRNVMTLCWGLPAIASVTITAVAVWAGQQSRADGLFSQYRTAALLAIQQDDRQAADVSARKLAYLDSSDPAGKYIRGLVAELRDDTARAGHVMQQIAPVDDNGYGPAHFWLARHLIGRQEPLSPDELSVLRHHLQMTVEDDADHSEAHALLGDLYAKQRKFEPAAEHYARAVEQQPWLRLALAEVYLQLNQQAQADHQAELAGRYFAKQVRAHPQDARTRMRWAQSHVLREGWSAASEILMNVPEGVDPAPFQQALSRLFVRWSALLWAQPDDRKLTVGQMKRFHARKSQALEQARSAEERFRKMVDANPQNINARLRWAEVQILLRNYDQAAATLQQAVAVWPDEPRLQQMLAGVTVSRSAYLWSQDDLPIQRKLKGLQQALSLAPQHPLLLKQLAQLARSNQADADQAREILEDALAKGTAPATVHLLLGSAALSRDDSQQALVHLEQAHRLEPKSPVIFNNLAWVISQAEPPDLNRARRLVDAAAELAPDNPEIRESRGQILMKQERWNEALADLEIALSSFPDRPALHRALATVYENLGLPELAEKHRRQAQ